MDDKTLECDFCEEFSSNEDNTFARLYRGFPRSRILFQSDNFAVVPSLGQIVEGYLLVLPKRHFRALGDMPGLLLNELVELCSFVGNDLEALYGTPIFFEHGTRAEGVGGCGIYHAHLHVVPLSNVADPINVLKKGFHHTELASLCEIEELSADLPTYLFFRDSGARLYLFDTGPLPSQYMRKLLADAIGGQEWNWRNAGREDRLLATIERLAPRFKLADKSILQK